MTSLKSVLAAAIVLLVGSYAMAEEASKLLFGFENETEVRHFEFNRQTAEFSDQHVTQGSKSLKLKLNDALNMTRDMDWSGYESVDIDIFVEGDQPVTVTLCITDQEFNNKKTYWNRHNAGMQLRPGANRVSIPLNGLYRGEAGSRYNDLKSSINPAQLTRFVLDFQQENTTNSVYIDNMRLVKASRPANVLAFDFGPDSQTIFPGFDAIGRSTVYGKNGAKAGLRVAAPERSARDSTSPTRLVQDFIMLEDEEFVVDLPNGHYKVWMVFENSGYWGGEQAQFSKRSIFANGKEADVEDRGPDGAADYLYHFENIEPKPGDSMWDLYAKYLLQPRRFEADVTEGQLVLKVHSGTPFSSKVAGVIIYPAGSEAGEKWVAKVEQQNKEEFESRAVFMGPQAKALEVPETAKAQGYWVGYPTMEDEITFVAAPGKAEGKLERVAALDQRVTMTFAIRPLKDFSSEPVALTASDLKGEQGVIPAAEVDLRYVHHGTRRSFNSMSYQIVPRTLRPVQGSELKLAKDLTRQFWITVHVPADAKAGTYSGQLMLKAGELSLQLPYSVEVVGLKLDEPAYSMGFFGLQAPDQLPGKKADAYRAILKMLKENGMTSFTGGPNLEFKGLDASGKPIIEGYAEVDEFFRICREVGYNQPVASYGGPGMVGGLHDGYVIGETGRNWAKQTGKSFEELLKIVWNDVAEHGKQHNWLPVLYGMTDEPRVVESAYEQLELMRAYRKAVPFVEIGGFYSVNWKSEEPMDKAHQEIFKTLTWSGLGGWGEDDVKAAKQYNKTLWMYGAGASRFGFGAYQWACMNKGIKGRCQWHFLALHGYQFYDLDGREPDYSAVMFGRNGIIPTPDLPRCREGADDLKYAVTLWNLAQKNKDKAEAQAAIAWLQQIADSIPAGKSEKIEALKDNETFRNTCIKYIRALMQE